MENTSSEKTVTGSLSEHKEKILFVAAAAFCLFVFMISLLRAGMTGITYDEAYTYLEIASRNMLDREILFPMFSREGCIANNHWLNSFLIFAIDRLTGASYDEFVIRIPSLAAFAVYLFAVYRCYKKKLFSFPVLILLAGNYYLDEFYGLARGYGMANTFVFLLCVSMIRWKKFGYGEMKYLNLAMLYAMLAVFSNTIVLLLYPAIGIVCLYRLVSEKQFGNFLKKCGTVFIVFLVFSALMAVYHLNISSEGKPLFTGGGRGFFNCFVKGYVRMFVAKERLVTVGSMLITCLAAAAFLIRWQGRKISDAGMMLVIFILTNLFMQAVFHKGYITERVLLPFYAFMVLALSEVIFSAAERFKEPVFLRYAGMIASIILCLACLFLFVKKINLHETRDWKSDYKYKTMWIGKLMTDVDFGTRVGAQHVFYQNKYNYLIKDYYLLLVEEGLWAPDITEESLLDSAGGE